MAVQLTEEEVDRDGLLFRIAFLERELAIARLDCDNAELALRAERRKVASLQTQLARHQADEPRRQDVAEVYEEWKARCNHPRSKLGPKRFAAVAAMLKLGYSVDDLKLAVQGAGLVAFEKDGKTYDDLELICRNEVNVERFREAGERLARGEDPRPLEQRPALRRVVEEAAANPWHELNLVLRQVRRGDGKDNMVDAETGDELYDCPVCHIEDVLAFGIEDLRCRECAAGPRDVIAALRTKGQA